MRRCSLKKRKIAAKTRWQRELNQYPIFKPVDLSEFHTVARTAWRPPDRSDELIAEPASLTNLSGFVSDAG